MRIPLSIPNLTDLEAKAVSECVQSGWVSSAGPQLDAFAAQCAAITGRKFAVPTVNGTAALHLALLTAGVKPGDLVIVPALTFIASANAVRHAGAIPIFVDADASTWQMDAELLEQFLRSETTTGDNECHHRKSGARIAALLVVDVLGHLGPMERYQQLANEFHLPLLEDAAGAIGSRYGGQPAGSFGKVSALSFNGNKIVTTGGGGMLLTDDASVAARARHLSTQAKSHPTEYAHDEVGYNYRMTALSAALGMAQLSRLEEFLQRKREVFAFYNAAFADTPEVCPFRPALQGLEPNHWLYTVAAKDSRGLEAHLAARGIETRKLWQPLPAQVPFVRSEFVTRTDVAQSVYESSLSLPCSTGITLAEMDEVVKAVKEFYR